MTAARSRCPAEPADLADDVVWVPANSFGSGVLADLASPGSRGHREGSGRVIASIARRWRSTTSSAFGHDAVVGHRIKAVLIFVVLVLLTLFNIWWERRVVARMQHRIGPNVNGPFGLLQSLADGVKLALKEDIIPKAADKVVFLLAPVIAVDAGVRHVRGDPVRARGDDPVLRHASPRSSSRTCRSPCCS